MRMMNVKDLSGPALDWAVAQVEGLELWGPNDVQYLDDQEWIFNGLEIRNYTEIESSSMNRQYTHTTFSPSSNPAQGHAIIERDGISVIRVDDDFGKDEQGFCNNVRIPVWCATNWQHSLQTSTEHQHHDPMFQIYESDVVYGPTALTAAMRMHVTRKHGKTIEIPEKLL